MNISHEVLSRDEALKVVTLDAPNQSTDVQKYVRGNLFSYYIAMNTWLLQVEVADEWGMLACKQHLIANGLISTIKDMDDDALRLVQGQDPETEIGRLINRLKFPLPESYFDLGDSSNFLRDDLASRLQLLRFLKRFSPSYNDITQEKGLRSFLENENATKMKQRVGYPQWLVSKVREEIAEVLDWEKLCVELEDYSDYDFVIPPGTPAEGSMTFGEKISFIADQYPEWFKMPFGLPYVFPTYASFSDDKTSKVQPVPKSYKTPRIIAMEPLCRQAKAIAFGRTIQKYLPDCIDVTDQGRNQQLALEGSIKGSVATLDASNASDLISKTLGAEVLPPRFWALVSPLLSTYIRVGNRVKPMQMLSTSGNGLTFILETIIYYGIAAAACRYTALFMGKAKEDIPCSVYGDDVAISTSAAVTACEFYTLLGLKINIGKSYISGPYRESCGKEYLNGTDLSTVYYPRFPVIGSITSTKIELGVKMYRDTYRGKIDDSTTMLVDLQKRVYPLSYKASMFLWSVLHVARPRITSSRYTEECNDCWAAMELGVPYNLAERDARLGEVKLSEDVVRACATQRHSYAAVRYQIRGSKPTESQMRAFDIYKYQTFLRTGPTFASPLDELLGVSEPPISLDQAFGEGRLVWKYEVR